MSKINLHLKGYSWNKFHQNPGGPAQGLKCDICLTSLNLFLPFDGGKKKASLVFEDSNSAV